MTTVLVIYMLIGICFTTAFYIAGKKYKGLYWLVGVYFPLTFLCSTLLWPVFIPCVVAIAIIDHIIEEAKK